MHAPRLLATLGALALAGCATRGPLVFDCPPFAPEPLVPGAVVRSVQADQHDTGELSAAAQEADRPADPLDAAGDIGAALAGAPELAATGSGPCSRLDPIARALVEQSGGCNGVRTAARSNLTVLLLSGGGQWGAFGAAFLAELDRRGAAPPATVITGISTGAMQAVLLADHRPDRYRRLVDEYTIRDEHEIVDRGPRVAALLTGSVAGLAPLVRKINRVLCDDATIGAASSGAIPDCLLTRLADRDAARVSVAFVENESGRLMVVDINRLAGLYRASAPSMSLPAKLRQARTCVTAAAVASSAMPAFYQPVRVTYRDPHTGTPVTRTLLDGGVRQSVFLPAVSQRVAAVQRAAGKGGAQLFVLRNGPTAGKVSRDKERANVLDTALRAYDIVANQLEVGSIAALRTEIGAAPIALATADGAATRECIEDRDASGKRAARMFDPAFMACLQSVGVAKAARPDPWLALAPVSAR